MGLVVRVVVAVIATVVGDVVVIEAGLPVPIEPKINFTIFILFFNVFF